MERSRVQTEREIPIDELRMSSRYFSELLVIIGWLGFVFAMITVSLKLFQNQCSFSTLQQRDDDLVHLIISIDNKQMNYIFPLIRSITENSDRNIFLHLVLSGNLDDFSPVLVKLGRSGFKKGIGRCKGSRSLIFDVTLFNCSVIDQLIRIESDRHLRLASPANFARLFIADLFPSIEKLIYLDVDIIVQGDIGELWDLSLNSDILIACARRNMTYSAHLSNRVGEIFQERYGFQLDFQRHSFNSGVFVANLAQWRRKQLT